MRLGKGKVFDCFKSGLDAEASRLGIGQEPTWLLGRTVPGTFFIAPHFSYCAAFKRKSKICGWTARFDRFAAAHPSFVIDSTRNLAARRFWDGDHQEVARQYMFEVLLGG